MPEASSSTSPGKKEGNGVHPEGKVEEPARFTESPTPLTEFSGEDDNVANSEGDESEGDEGTTASQDDEGDEEDEEGEEEEEEYEEEEPSLKYSRIIGAIPDLFKKDSASALAVSNKIMV